MKLKWILPSLALAVVLGVALTAVIPAQTVTPDESTLKLFPMETRGIAFVDVAGLQSSALFQQFVGDFRRGNTPAEIRDFTERTGFVPERDIERATVGKIGSDDVLAVVRAKFDRVLVEQYIANKNVTSETYLGRVIFTGDEARHGLALVDGLILAGTIPGVKQAIDRLAAPAPNALQNDRLAAAIRTIEVGHQVWAVGEFSDDLNIARTAPGPAREALSQLRSGTYQMRVDQDLHVRAAGDFADAEKARTLGEALRGLLAVAKLQVGQQQDLLRLLDGVRIDHSGTQMTVRFDATGETLQKLHNLRNEISRRRAAE